MQKSIPAKHINKNTFFRRDGKLSLTLLYLSCGLLVVIYANLYSVFALFNHLLGSGFITVVPILIPLLLLGWLATTATGYGRNGRRDVAWRWLLPGIAICIMALLVPDPRIGVKRIHVSEYLLLSLLVRFTMSHRLSGIPLLVFSALFTAMLGIHDEFLQGLHPLRTYGLRDMLVNCLSGAGGSIIWHSLNLFSEKKHHPANDRMHATHALYLVWLIVSVLAMAVPMTAYLHHRVPLWLSLPLAASLVCWSCQLSNDDSPAHHGVATVSGVAVLFLIYPVAINSFNLPFA